ncbi:uncharacterized protein K489DRAFT_400550 [Dissoconium aciculare CBS 342.82]|uniref:Uncharacterized protein n=1 Tax=Dissoconium aciculare CBS 342.82 TaxID=1314786 RepID=A0A6J3MAR6_9PEZI|nr:uncharacterized protein K489DRAFT_400550 [Dissoconium aciculare CBS 342.82]KAF1824724.1 hypothetical protein K489DRAFT_400550 [Dissoconium aciculare CBS 342.82]
MDNPNIFTQTYLFPFAEWVKNFRKSGKQETLRLMASEDTPVGIVDRNEAGIFAAFLLAQDDITPYHNANYNLNATEDIDLSFADRLAAETSGSRTVILSIKRALKTALEGKCMASTTSGEVVRLCTPKRAPAEMFGTMLEKQEYASRSKARTVQL